MSEKLDLKKIIAKADLAIEMRIKASPMVAGLGYMGDIPPETVRTLCKELIAVRAAPGKKVYRAGEAVPDGFYWWPGPNGHEVVEIGTDMGEQSMFRTGVFGDNTLDFPLIPIDPPEGGAEE